MQDLEKELEQLKAEYDKLDKCSGVFADLAKMGVKDRICTVEEKISNLFFDPEETVKVTVYKKNIPAQTNFAYSSIPVNPKPASPEGTVCVAIPPPNAP